PVRWQLVLQEFWRAATDRGGATRQPAPAVTREAQRGARRRAGAGRKPAALRAQGATAFPPPARSRGGPALVFSSARASAWEGADAPGRIPARRAPPSARAGSDRRPAGSAPAPALRG